MLPTTTERTLTAEDRPDLHRLVRAASTPPGLARRARCVLLLVDGGSYAAVRDALGVTDQFIATLEAPVWRWRTAGARRRAPREALGSTADAALQVEIVHLTQHVRSPARLTQWTSQRLAQPVGLSQLTVIRM